MKAKAADVTIPFLLPVRISQEFLLMETRGDAPGKQDTKLWHNPLPALPHSLECASLFSLKSKDSQLNQILTYIIQKTNLAPHHLTTNWTKPF